MEEQNCNRLMPVCRQGRERPKNSREMVRFNQAFSLYNQCILQRLCILQGRYLSLGFASAVYGCSMKIFIEN